MSRPKVPSAPIAIDEVVDLTQILERKHSTFLGERFFSMETSQDESHAYATVTLRNASASYFYPIEGRIACRSQELSGREGALILLDFMDVYFEEFFREGEDTWLTIDWMNYSLEGFSFQMKGQLLNKFSDEIADLFLEGKLNAEEAARAIK